MALVGEALYRPSYTFLHTISEGNAAICSKVFHEIYQRDMVQKTISVLGITDGLAASEPGMLVRMDHPHLVRVREAQWDPQYPDDLRMITFVTEFYAGLSVQTALLEGHKFSISEALKIIDGVLDALHYLHVTHRVIHRDVKPANVMLDTSRTHAYLGDLGSAAYMPTEAEHVDASSGTILYRPPEYVNGSLGVRSDLYSTGMTLFECLNGALPYQDLDGNVLEQRANQGKRVVSPKYLKSQPHVPSSVAKFVRLLMNEDLGRRPVSAAAALIQLRRLDYVDWRQMSSTEWEGTYPPRQPITRRRRYRVSAVPVSAGPNRGKLHLTAAWALSLGPWRSYASLERRVEVGDDSALAAFFREVELRAQAAPTK